jgi:hypothetical protein
MLGFCRFDYANVERVDGGEPFISSIKRRTIMKNLIGLVILVFVVGTLAAPSAGVAQNAFNQKDKVVSAGIGLGLYGLYGSSTLPPIFVAFETGVAEKITVGGIAAYAGSSEDFFDGKFSYSYIVLSARGAYHFLEREKSFDAYGGAGLGYTIVSSSVEYNNPAIQHFGFSASGSYFFFDLFVGGRYYFNPRLAALAELGYGVGFLRIGLSYKI